VAEDGLPTYDPMPAALFLAKYREGLRAARNLRAVHGNFGASANVCLFGSRTDDTKRGGDIDLHIETDFDQSTVARRSALLQKKLCRGSS
jgi:hypothetical protein